MSAEQRAAGPQVVAAGASTMKANQTMIVGKVAEVTDHAEGYFTRVMIAAKDQYSNAGIVDIRSKKRIGRQDEEVRVLCDVSGFRRKGNKETARGEPVYFVSTTLTAVE